MQSRKTYWFSFPPLAIIAKIGLLVCLLTISPGTLVASELAEIQARGKFKVAVKDNLRPLSFTNESGNLTGLEIDIARKLAEEILGDSQAVKFIPVSNESRLQVVLDGEVDITIARVAVTTSRSRIVDFSRYYYLDGTGVVTKDSQITQIRNLTDARIAVLENSATIAVIRHKLPNANLIGVSSYQEALELIEANLADAFAGDRSVLTGWTQEHPTYNLLPERLSGAALAIVMPKGLQYQKLRSKINRVMSDWQKSGWLQERIEFWQL